MVDKVVPKPECFDNCIGPMNNFVCMHCLNGKNGVETRFVGLPGIRNFRRAVTDLTANSDDPAFVARVVNAAVNTVREYLNLP